MIRPQPKLMAVREDRTGRLWTLVLVAHPRWKPLAPRNKAGRESPMSPEPDVNAIDTLIERIVEVIEPSTGRVLASRRLPGSYVDFVGPDAIFRRREAADGTIEVEIHRLALTHARARK